MITLSTYPTTPEVLITRAEIDRLTLIIRQLNDALDAAADREDRLRHDVELQRARAEVAEAMLGNCASRCRAKDCRQREGERYG